MTSGGFSKLAAALLIGAVFCTPAVEALAQSRERGESRRDYSRPGSRYDDARRDQRSRDLGPRMAPAPLPGPGGWRRGQYLPEPYRGARVPDIGRYRLRQPPPGYDWVTVGPDIYLVQRSSGLVLDAVPGGF